MTFTKAFAALVSLALPLSSIAAASPSDAASTWNCFDLSNVADNNYGLTVKLDEEGHVTTIDVTHSGFLGASKVTTLPLCETRAPEAGMADGAMEVKCHDGLWTGSYEATLALGGFVPFIGSGTLSFGGPGKATRVTDFSCTLRSE